MEATVISNRERFIDEYARQLADAVVRYPDEYGWPVENVPTVVAKMSAAFDRGSYNKAGRAIKGTCKALGIAYTYTAINAFLKA